jgi:iron complex transport system substrate-binding protein
MNNVKRLFVVLFLLCAFSAFSAFESVAFEAVPQRIASMNLTADEILVELVPLDRLVAATAAADDAGTSNVVGRIPAGIARFRRAEMERLLALSPDLVVVSEYTDADFLRLVELSGLRVHRMRGLDSLPGFRAAILDLGRAVGAEAAAGRLVARYDAVLAELGRRLMGTARPRLLYWAGGMTAGARTAIGGLIEAAGAVNVGREMGLEGIAPVGAERAFVADPDAVLVGEGWKSVEALEAHPLLSQMRAVRQKRIVAMPTELLVTLSHHAAEACWYLAWSLHPDRVPRPRP